MVPVYKLHVVGNRHIKLPVRQQIHRSYYQLSVSGVELQHVVVHVHLFWL